MKRRFFLSALLCGSAQAAEILGFREDWDEVFDIVVVGGGGAGLAAALSAAEEGAEVLVIEKQSFIGGDTLICGGYYNAPGTEFQEKQGIQDNPDLFFNQTMKSGGGLNSPNLVEKFREEVLPTFKWLQDNGVKFSDKVYLVYGSLHQRCHKPFLPRGTAYIQALSNACMAKGVILKTSTELVDLVMNTYGAVEGIIAKNGDRNVYYQAVKGVILAAGGFGANPRMVEKYSPLYKDLPPDSAPGSTGEVLEIARSHGAAVTNMDILECIPEGSKEPGLSVRIYTLTQGIIFVNSRGQRFVDEAADRQKLTRAILSQKNQPCYIIVDNTNVKMLDKIQLKNLYRSLYAGLAWKADSLEEMAKQLNIPFENLQKSFAQASPAIRPETPPYWAVEIHLWIHYTLGGLVITPNAQVLNEKGQVIPGLYAAGQITGNLHGANRIGGNGLTDAIVFGRIAGKTASRSWISSRK